jgi:hypothetical protein
MNSKEARRETNGFPNPDSNEEKSNPNSNEEGGVKFKSD